MFSALIFHHFSRLCRGTLQVEVAEDNCKGHLQKLGVKEASQYF